MDNDKYYITDTRREITQRAIERADAGAWKVIVTLIGCGIAGLCLWIAMYWLCGGRL